MPKTRYNFTIEEDTLASLKLLAEWDNRAVSNYLETLINNKFIEMAPVYQAGMKQAQDIYNG